MRLNRRQTTTAVLQNNVTATAAEAGGLKKKKKPKSRRQSQTSPCLAGRPEPVDKRCPRASSAMAGRPAPASGTHGSADKALLGEPRWGRAGPHGARVQPCSGAEGEASDPPRAQAPPQNGGHVWQRLRSVPAPGSLLGAHPPRGSAPSGHIGAALRPRPLRPPRGC